MSDFDLARGVLNDVTVTISGQRQEVTGWTGLQIVRGIDQAADAFSFSFPWEATAENQRRFVAYKTSLIEIKYGGELVVTGIAEKYEPSYSAGGVEMTINGRSISGTLLDLSAGPPFESDASFNALALQIIPEAVDKDGNKTGRPIVSVRAIPDITSAGDNELYTQIEPGQTIYEVLSELASAHGLFAFPQSDGSLIFRLINTPAPATEIREGIAPVISVNTSMDITKRYHRYTVMRTDGGETSTAEALDDGVDKGLRNGLIVEPKQDADVQFAANFARSRGIMDSYSCAVTVAGWTVNGQLWRPGMTVTANFPSAMIYRDYVFMVRRATLQLDETGGAIAQLELTFPQVFAGGNPTFPYPWSLA
jgi:prophage tail gpP-like protein